MGVRSWEANLYSREQEWRERAEKAEAELARLREAIRKVMDAYYEIDPMGVLPFRRALVHMEQVARITEGENDE